MEFVIITGLSGAGKTHALHALEDIGFYCVDNIPPQLLHTFYNLCESGAMKKVAVVVDIRAGDLSDPLKIELKKIAADGKKYKILYLDAKKEVLLTRYKETRRKHPLADSYSGCTTEDAVVLEEQLLHDVKVSANYIIDTSFISVNQLKQRVITMFTGDFTESLLVTCVSFGFKYGVPLEADLMFDVRCLPNPFYIPELKPLTGLDEAVREYVLSFDETKQFIDKLLPLIDYLIPLYKKECKSELVIAIGCTGGKHRSVTIARLLNAHFLEMGQKSAIQHRDIWKA